MAMKPNYNFEKRQRELAKKKQQDEKRQEMLARTGANPANSGDADQKPQS